MLIYEILKQEHDRIKFLLTEIAELTVDDVKWHNALITQLRDALIPHSKAEEDSFYDAIHAKDKAKNIALHGYHEHLSAEYLLRTLSLKDRLDQDWKSVAMQLKSAVENHISDEENAIFPIARQVFTEQSAYSIGQQFLRLRDEYRLELSGPVIPKNLFEKTQQDDFKARPKASERTERH